MGTYIGNNLNNYFQAYQERKGFFRKQWKSWWIVGNGGNDYLIGGAKDDSIYGNGEHDSLLGKEGNDYLSGGWGNDYLDGGLGWDRMYGGTGLGKTHLAQAIGHYVHDHFPGQGEKSYF